MRTASLVAAPDPGYQGPPGPLQQKEDQRTSMAITSVGNAPTLSEAPGATNYSAMAMVTGLFFIWGFTTVLNDALIPHLQSVFSLNYVEALLIQLAFFGSYFLFAQPASWLIERF